MPNKNDCKSTKKKYEQQQNDRVTSDIAHKLNTLIISFVRQLFHRFKKEEKEHTQTSERYHLFSFKRGSDVEQCWNEIYN